MNLERGYQFGLRWKEELVASIPGGRFVIEAPMGELSVYFPLEDKWERSAPGWARGRWAEIKLEIGKWCERQNIPIHFEQDAWIEFEDDDQETTNS